MDLCIVDSGTHIRNYIYRNDNNYLVHRGAAEEYSVFKGLLFLLNISVRADFLTTL